jgi:PIN domain nuclease of toxin-antitoxin system
MPLLIDTHYFLWLVFEDKSLLPKELKIILDFAKKDTVLVSAISIWEIAILEKNGRVNLYQPAHSWAEEALKTPGLTLAPLTPEILCESVALPGDIHKDPADRMIVATARLMHAKLMTRDKKILEYAEQGYVNCINA